MKQQLNQMEDNILGAEKVLEEAEMQLDEASAKILRVEFYERMEAIQMSVNNILLNR